MARNNELFTCGSLLWVTFLGSKVVEDDEHQHFPRPGLLKTFRFLFSTETYHHLQTQTMKYCRRTVDPAGPCLQPYHSNKRWTITQCETVASLCQVTHNYACRACKPVMVKVCVVTCLYQHQRLAWKLLRDGGPLLSDDDTWTSHVCTVLLAGE